MVSQSLYRKWRSQTFSDLVGQETVTRTLQNAVRDNRLAHAYLFCGPRGTGKTSTARLLAKAVNCTHPQAGEPCNECLSCREITAGHSPDVIEIDAASNTGVDNIRDLRENVNLMGMGGGYKFYIIDEAHMLSTQAFNALLKTLEEPPPRVIFVLATTEAHKVPPTVVSRCQPFYFRRFGLGDLQARIRYIAKEEDLQLDPGAAELLARAAQGGMRDALSLLDQAMAFCGTRIDLPATRALLGLADPTTIKALIESVATGDAAEGLQLINDMVGSGADLRQLSSQIGELFRTLMLARAGADVTQLAGCPEDEVAQVSELAERFTLAELTACARLFARNETPARGLPVPQLALELSLLDCIHIRAERRPEQPAPEATHRREPPSSRAMNMPVVAEELDLDTLQPIQREPLSAPSVNAPLPAPVMSAGDAPPPSGGDDSLETLVQAQQQWDLVKQVCNQKSRSVAALLHSAYPVKVESEEPLLLILEAVYQFHLDKLREPESRVVLEWALEQVLNRPVHIRLTLRRDNGDGGTGGGSTPSGPGGQGQRQGGSLEVKGGNTHLSSQKDAWHARAVDSVPAAGGGAPTRRSSSAPRSNITPIRRDVQPVPSGPDAATSASLFVPAAALLPNSAEIDAGRIKLEAEVRADPVIQSLLRLQGMELVDLRMLHEDE
jgi:DNA polymerase-3 subunit gamma/tau